MQEDEDLGNPSERMPFKSTGNKEKDILLWKIARLEQSEKYKDRHIEWQAEEFRKTVRLCWYLVFIMFVLGLIVGCLINVF